ncbi:hypothetical protein W02_03480 [Nitrospira sp. KM1]|nr:hypothetical protein W02_03480 [Nitrospira sp. KM1]
MQMFGTTMTLWDLQLQFDPIDAQALEEFSVPATISIDSPIPVVTSDTILAMTYRPGLHELNLFRPPIAAL